MSFETNSLRLDVYFKKKQVSSGYQKLDRRNIRQKLTPEEILEKKLVTTLLNFGETKPNLIVADLKKIKNIENLNPDLIVLVYLYFVEKKSNIDLVVADFDNDFDKQLEIIREKKLFPKLQTPYQKFLFRQDFIMYLILLTEENTNETEYIEDDYEDDSENEYESDNDSYLEYY